MAFQLYPAATVKGRDEAPTTIVSSHSHEVLENSTTTHITTGPPVAAVFDTYELLERILLHLPMRNLLSASSINKTFQAIITRSKAIQQALFLQADMSAYARDSRPPSTTPTINWHLFRNCMPQLGPGVFGDCTATEISGGNGSFEVKVTYDMSEGLSDTVQPPSLCAVPSDNRSWRKMYLTMPECWKITVMLENARRRPVGQVWFWENGSVTMGRVQEGLRELYSQTLASENWRDYANGAWYILMRSEKGDSVMRDPESKRRWADGLL